MYVGKLRSKEGTLEMQKTKKRWKDYLFRVNAQTYLLCFRLDNLGEPKDKIMLTHIIKIEAAPMKDADFPFAVHFKGKGSPWILRAKNDTERKQWMEAIKPGSSSCLSQPPPTTQRSHHQPVSNPTVDPRSSRPLPSAHALQNRPQTIQHSDRRITATRSLPYNARSNTFSGRSNTIAHPGHSRGADIPKQLHKTPSADDQYVVMGSTGRQQPHYMHQHQMQQQPHQTVPPPQATVDSQARYQNTASAQPQGLYHNAPQQQVALGNQDRLALYHNAPQHGQMGPAHPPASNGHSLYQNHPTAGSSAQQNPAQHGQMGPAHPPASNGQSLYQNHPTAGSSAQQNPAHGIYNVPRKQQQQQGPTSQQLQPAYQNPSAEIAPSITNPQSSTFQNSSPQSSSQSSVAAGSGSQQVLGMVEKMSQKFSPAQLQLMTEMLRELQTAEEEEGGGQGENAATSSLRSTLEKVLETTPDQHAYELLLDEETTKKSNYHYVPRPAWAKAETTEPRQELPSTNEDTELTELLTIPKTDLKSFVQIGEGQFGKVFKALLQRGAGAAEVEVAVKTTKAASSEKEKSSFLKEMRIMAVMMHPNIVKLYGLVQDDGGGPWIVIEYLLHGDLKNFLQRNPRPVPQLLKYMVDVSMGMHYLSEKGLVHRDLAARNILVGEGETCKVADFGLLRELPKDDTIYEMKTEVPCPVRWMSPESMLNRTFSVASDVWSYGILLWEMFHPDRTPYDEFKSNLEVATNVHKGYRLEVPEECPRVVSKIMGACWQHEPNKRPSFLLIYRTLLSVNITS